MPHTQDALRSKYSTPRLKLYGSVQALTAAGTGMISEAGSINMDGTPGKCYDGVTPGPVSTRKHCV